MRGSMETEQPKRLITIEVTEDVYETLEEFASDAELDIPAYIAERLVNEGFG